jgi:twinkle protein
MWRAILTRKFASRRSRLVRKNGCSWTTTTTSNTTAIISTNQSRPLLCCSSLSLADPPTSTCSPFLTTARTFHTLNSSSFVDNNNHYNCNHFHHHQYQQHRTKVFVSRYNDALNITVPMILDQCRNYNISPEETRTTRSHVVLKECPFCTKPTHDKPDNFYKLYVSIGSGCYFCHRCGNKGSWFDFKLNTERFDVVHVAGGNGSSCSGSSGSGRLPTSARASNDVHANDRDSEHWNRRNNNPNTASSSSRSSTTTTIPPLPMPSERLAACYISALVDQKPSNDNTNQNPVLDYLTNVRGLHKTTLRKYGVGRANYNFPTTNSSTTTHNGRQQYTSAECVTFPWIMKASEVHEQEQLRGSQFLPYNDNDNEDKTVTRRIKARALQEKSWQRLDPPGGGWGLFGFHTIPEDATEVVITEGEYDAMAVYQATGRPAVSLPNGCRSLPVEVLPMLERFEKIYLWMDNDAPGQEGAEKFAKKIGQNRCLIVRPDMVGGEEACSSPKDANEALLKGVDMQQMLDNAKVVPHEMVLSFEDLRTSVLHEIVHPDKYVGAPAPSLPLFTSVVKGFRRGEMTVLTGPTGSGKVSRD